MPICAEQCCVWHICITVSSHAARARCLPRFLFFQLASALDHCHHHALPNARIIHRDLKPANLGLMRASDSQPERVVLFDFGLATVFKLSGKADAGASERRRLTACTGSRRYMAPEVMRGEAYNHTCDCYSFGVLLWQMLAHDAPFDELRGLDELTYTERVSAEHFRPKLRPSWPAELSDLISECWTTDPAARPEMGRAAERLSALIASGELVRSVTPPSSRPASSVGGKLRRSFFTSRSPHQTGEASPADVCGRACPSDEIETPSFRSSSGAEEEEERSSRASALTAPEVQVGSGPKLCHAVPAVPMGLLEAMAAAEAAPTNA